MSSTVRTVATPSAINMPKSPTRWEISNSRLEDTTPHLHEPGCVKNLIPGTQVTGTIITMDAAASDVILDVTPGEVFRHNVRNVLTYSASATEATFSGLINEGYPVFYDRGGSMPTHVWLSLSPNDCSGGSNPLFGFIVRDGDETTADFPKGASTVGTTVGAAVMQIGFSCRV